MPVSITIEALLLRRLANTSLPCHAMQPVINVSVFDRGGGGDELPLQGHNYELMLRGCTSYVVDLMAHFVPWSLVAVILCCRAPVRQGGYGER